MSDAPQSSPVCQPLIHSLWHRSHAVRSLPSQFATLQTAKETFEALLVSFLEPLAVLERDFISGSLLGLLELVAYCLKHQVCRMWIPKTVPMVTGVKKLCPRGCSNPMAVCMPDAAHEALDWSCLRSCWLLHGKLQDCPQLLPECWTAFTPGVPFGMWHQRLGDRLQVIPAPLRRPRVLLKEVLLRF